MPWVVAYTAVQTMRDHGASVQNSLAAACSLGLVCSYITVVTGSAMPLSMRSMPMYRR
jgi:hypothetical protein